MTNMFQIGGDPESHVRVMRMDAAKTEQAYWIVRAHKEGQT